jgi:CubicO group peptidase (beta-lactamase class C family)
VGRWTQGQRVTPLVFRLRAVGAKPSWPALAPAPLPANPVTDGQVREILRQHISSGGVGMVVGIIDRRGRRVIAAGRGSSADPRPLDGDTAFEIGSISKVFTSLLLQQSVSRGELKLDEPAGRFAPKGMAMPQSGGRQITLADLSTHHSGLPGDDAAFWGKDPNRVTANYDTARLLRFVTQAKLSHAPGTRYNYSNIGASVLGQFLARQADKPYGQLVRERIAAPLGMNATTLAPAPAARVAIGHNDARKPVPPFEAQAYDPAGGLRSTTNDMLTFLGAELGAVKTPLAPALRAQWSTLRRQAINPGIQVALGWHVTLRPRGDIVWHNGGTPGFRTFAGFNPRTGVGVVVLSNATTGRPAPNDIGLHLLDPSWPLEAPAP